MNYNHETYYEPQNRTYYEPQNGAPYQYPVQIPQRYPEVAQRWIPTTAHPYPMNFVQAPSPNHQVLVMSGIEASNITCPSGNKVTYNGQPYTQGLHTTAGPRMFPYPNVRCDSCPSNSWERKHTVYPRGENPIAYPTTHSIPGPFLQSYISLPKRVYGY